LLIDGKIGLVVPQPDADLIRFAGKIDISYCILDVKAVASLRVSALEVL